MNGERSSCCDVELGSGSILALPEAVMPTMHGIGLTRSILRRGSLFVFSCVQLIQQSDEWKSILKLDLACLWCQYHPSLPS